MEPNKPSSTPAAERRRQQIEDCLYENLQHTSYQSISVADLCRQVGISRKAFYNYYPSKDACLCAFLDRVIGNSMLYTTRAVPDNADLLQACTVNLEYWKKQKPLFDIILRNQLLYLFLQQNIRHVMEEERSLLDLLSTEEVNSDTDILGCYVGIQLTLLLQWHSRNYDTPADEMARKYLRLIHSPMIPPATPAE